MLCVQKKIRMPTEAWFVFTGKGGSGIDEDAYHSQLCVQGKSGIVTMVLFVFRRKAGGGSDWRRCRHWCALCLSEKREAAVTDEDADIGVLCVQGQSGRRQWRRCWLWYALCSGEKREAAVTKMLTVVCFIYVATITPSVTQAFFRTLIPGYLPSG